MIDKWVMGMVEITVETMNSQEDKLYTLGQQKHWF